MLSFIISALFGAGQILLTEQLVLAVNVRDSKKIFLFFAVKVLLYTLGIGLLVTKFVWHLSLVLCGFIIGVPITAIALFVYKTIYKK